MVIHVGHYSLPGGQAALKARPLGSAAVYLKSTRCVVARGGGHGNTPLHLGGELPWDRRYCDRQTEQVTKGAFALRQPLWQNV